MRVLTLDPGERVGWARADIDDSGEWSNLRHGITPLKDMALAVVDRLNITDVDGATGFGKDYDVIVMEDWRLRPDKAREMVGSSFPSVQFIGMVRLCCWLSGTKLVMQGASVQSTADKSLASLWPEMHAKVTNPRAHDDAHDMSALKHMWFYTFQNTTLAHYLAERSAAA